MWNENSLGTELSRAHIRLGLNFQSHWKMRCRCLQNIELRILFNVSLRGANNVSNFVNYFGSNAHSLVLRDNADDLQVPSAALSARAK